MFTVEPAGWSGTVNFSPGDRAGRYGVAVYYAGAARRPVRGGHLRRAREIITDRPRRRHAAPPLPPVRREDVPGGVPTVP